MPEAASEVFVFNIDATSKPAAKAAKAVRQKALKPLARSFAKNIDNAQSVLKIPHYLLMWGYMQTQHLLAFTDVYLGFARRGLSYKDPAVKRQVDLEVTKYLQNKKSRKRFTYELAKWSTAEINKVGESEEFRSWSKRLLFSVVTGTWTAFEILAGDCWKLALNLHPELITTKRMQEALEKNGFEHISSKSISVAAAARYRFDLQNHVGDILAEDINFSNLKRVKKVYCDAFGEAPVLKSIFEDNSLQLLEQTRHLIVHRSAIVDDKFGRATKLKFPVGKELPLEKRFLSDITNAGMNYGGSLLSFLDDWLTNKSLGKQ